MISSSRKKFLALVASFVGFVGASLGCSSTTITEKEAPPKQAPETSTTIQPAPPAPSTSEAEEVAPEEGQPAGKTAPFKPRPSKGGGSGYFKPSPSKKKF